MKEVDDAFGYYLKRYRYKNSNIRIVLLGQQLFIDWIEERGVPAEQLRYQDIMDYVDHCRQQRNTHNTITGKVGLIKVWLDYRGVVPNPCKGWHIKRRPALLPPGLLSQIELEQLYHNHPEETAAEIRDKVIVGMMIYQGTEGGHLNRLEVKDVNLEVGFIIIGKTVRSNSRTIKIHSTQQVLLEHYIDQIRPKIMTVDTDKLIVKEGQMEKLRSFYDGFYKRLKKRYPQFSNMKQIRASVISNWLKHYNLREVQYMAGHRYVSSTERYMTVRIEDLQKRLDAIHPMK